MNEEFTNDAVCPSECNEIVFDSECKLISCEQEFNDNHNGKTSKIIHQTDTIEYVKSELSKEQQANNLPFNSKEARLYTCVELSRAEYDLTEYDSAAEENSEQNDEITESEMNVQPTGLEGAKSFIVAKEVVDFEDFAEPQDGEVSCIVEIENLDNDSKSVKTNGSSDIYVCNVCKYKTNREGIYQRHMRSHNNGGLFRCQFCDFTCMFRRQFKVHVNGQHMGFRCDECDKVYTRISDRDNHYKTVHSDERKYSCNFCDFKSNIKQVFKEHGRIHTGEVLRCDYEDCFFSTIYSRALSHHRKTLHTKSRPHACEICGKTFRDRSSLRNHAKLHEVTTEEFKCSECDYKTPFEKYLKNHVVKHSGSKPFECYICGIHLYRSQNLKVHLMTHLKIKPWICKGCKYRAVTRQKVERHAVNVHAHSKVKYKTWAERKNMLVKLAFDNETTVHTLFITDRSGKPITDEESGIKDGKVLEIAKKGSSTTVRDPDFENEAKDFVFIRDSEGRMNYYCEECGSSVNSVSGWKQHVQAYHPKFKNFQMLDNMTGDQIDSQQQYVISVEQDEDCEEKTEPLTLTLIEPNESIAVESILNLKNRVINEI